MKPFKKATKTKIPKAVISFRDKLEVSAFLRDRVPGFVPDCWGLHILEAQDCYAGRRLLVSGDIIKNGKVDDRRHFHITLSTPDHMFNPTIIGVEESKTIFKLDSA